MYDTKQCFSRNPHPEIDLDKWQKIVNLMSELYGSDCGTIVNFRQQEFNVVSASNNESNFLQRDSSWPWDMRSFCRRIVETNMPLYVNDAEASPEWSCTQPVTEGPVRSYLGFPVYWPTGEIFGTICVIDTKPTDYSENLIEVLEQFRDLLHAELNLAFELDKVRELSNTDELTKLHNRRGLLAAGEQKLKEATRGQKPISIIYLDIDNLKTVNDTYGHQAGDEGLKTLATLMEENTRNVDVRARIGGDEFVILLETDRSDYLQGLCEKLNSKFSAAVKGNEELTDMGVSTGYATFKPHEFRPLSIMIEEVDKIMYENKQNRKQGEAAE